MQNLNTDSLSALLQLYHDRPHINKIQNDLVQLTSNSPATDISKLISLYKKAISLTEDELWHHDLTDQHLNLYQQTFIELENLYASQHKDTRFKFIVVIPVADRPGHLEACLNSLHVLCTSYNYGGFHNGRYNKISVIIADDSKHDDSIRQHKIIAQKFTNLGIETDYFGLEQQLARINQLGIDQQQQLATIIGKIDSSNFAHKGASITRNITYLKLHDISQRDPNVLFFFIDSDQEFCVKIRNGNSDRNIYSTNYFYYLNEIFSTTQARIVTGKVVGDPPVSPAVMTSRFLDDVIDFLRQLIHKQPHQPCEFHQHQQHNQEGAYHDMADLFGFSIINKALDYNCRLKGSHDHSKCLDHFAQLLNHFFYGEHPTRSSYYTHENILENIKPARTVYTGNYVIKPDALDYFIPFATLKLRMAGPVLGRIIKSEIQDRFVSANLPMLHKRTFEDSGHSEFRPGITQQHQRIDLSGEFERQYFGDVMLFSVDKLTKAGFPRQNLDLLSIERTVKETESEIHQQYISKHYEIAEKIKILQALINDSRHWWHDMPEMADAITRFRQFIQNIQHNFGDNSSGYKLICSDEIRQARIHSMARAIDRYPAAANAWNSCLGS